VHRYDDVEDMFYHTSENPDGTLDSMSFNTYKLCLEDFIDVLQFKRTRTRSSIVLPPIYIQAKLNPLKPNNLKLDIAQKGCR
jgi:hypothetical protein